MCRRAGAGSSAHEPKVYPNQPSGTGSNATGPEVNPNQPSCTGYNAIESEVLPVLDLHDEACENAVTTDLEQPPVSEARSISCAVKNYVTRKDVPRVRAPTPINRRPRSPNRNRAPMTNISHRHPTGIKTIPELSTVGVVERVNGKGQRQTGPVNLWSL